MVLSITESHTHTAAQCECAFTLLYMVIAVNYIMCIILMIEGWRWPFAYRLLCWSAWSCPTGWHNQPNGLVTHLHCRFLVFIRSSHVRGPVIGDQIDYTCIGGHIGASWYFFFLSQDIENEYKLSKFKCFNNKAQHKQQYDNRTTNLNVWRKIYFSYLVHFRTFTPTINWKREKKKELNISRSLQYF